MKDYISREAALSAQNKSMNLAEMRERLKRIPAADVRSTEYCEECRDALLKTIDHYKQLCADVRPALWTDEPIIGTWFMTHNQGQSGFEIHFRTDDKAKYEAVQDECRRQIDHAKPAADVRPVARGKWIRNGWSIRCSECGHDMPFSVRNFCPNCGAMMEES